MGSLSIYGYTNGNSKKLMAPADRINNLCGFSPGFENYPYLYIDGLNDK
jgi:hypothetical protein